MDWRKKYKDETGKEPIIKGEANICPPCHITYEYFTKDYVEFLEQRPEAGQHETIVMRLACAIVSYESDMPHVETPDFKPDKDEYYPEISFEEIKEWQEMEHHGDCINMPTTCMRCIAGEAIHKAEFIASKISA